MKDSFTSDFFMTSLKFHSMHFKCLINVIELAIITILLQKISNPLQTISSFDTNRFGTSIFQHSVIEISEFIYNVL
jgi:hypothetical protein